MDDCEIIICRLCLDIINCDGLENVGKFSKDILDILLLKLDVDETNEIVTCSDCTTKLSAAFHFKIMCIMIEESISLNIKSDGLVDLKEIYLKNKESNLLTDTLINYKVCRFCMDLINNEFVSVYELDSEMIGNYIPEVNIMSTEEPVICKECFDSLHAHSSFLRKCLDGEERVKDIFEHNGPSNRSEMTEGKSEEIVEPTEFKTIFKDNLVQVFTETTKEQDKIDATLNFPSDTSTQHPVDQTMHKNTEEKNIHQYDKLNYKANSKSNLNRNKSRHKKVAVIQSYKCDTCDFKTCWKSNLKNHKLLHVNLLEAQMYKCDKCQYESKIKRNFERHQLKHIDVCEAEMYKCDKCDYVTKYKKYIAAHQLRHKDLKDVDGFKCDQCDFETKYKQALNRHHLTHKEKVKKEIVNCRTGSGVRKYQPISIGSVILTTDAGLILFPT